MNDQAALREEMVKTGRLLVRKGLVKGTGGNISVRTARGFLVTPSGMDYDLLTADDIVEMDLCGRVLSGERTPSIENRMHLAVLAVRNDVNAVVHVHSTFATAFACARRELDVANDNQSAVFGGPVAVAAYAPIGTQELADNVVKALGNEGLGVLLSNHGSLCVGGSVAEALFRCEMLEEFAKVALLSQVIGGAVSLTDEQARSEAEDLKTRYGQKT